MDLDLRQSFKSALMAKAKSLGRRLTPDEILDEVCAVHLALIPAKVSKPKKALETDEEWIAGLEADPALKGLNVRREINACALWYKTNVSKRSEERRVGKEC